MAVLQQTRVEVEDQNKNLQFHHENLMEELSRIQVQNRELKSFFERGGEEAKLASKMKTRIEELKDSYIEEKNKNSSLRVMRLTKIMDSVKKQLNRQKETNDFIEMKIKEEKNGTYNLDEKQIVGFFTNVMNSKDQEIQILKVEENSLNVLFELSFRKS